MENLLGVPGSMQIKKSPIVPMRRLGSEKAAEQRKVGVGAPFDARFASNTFCTHNRIHKIAPKLAMINNPHFVMLTDPVSQKSEIWKSYSGY